jgi:Spx/MgsR family transcriptional regulator
MSGAAPVTPAGIVLYGIETCDTCRNARRWLAARGITHRFHDLRRDGLDRPILDGWIARIAWDELPNRRGQTWRRIPDSTRSALRDAQGLIELALAEPLVLRRPVLDDGTKLLVGFSEQTYAAAFGLPG